MRTRHYLDLYEIAKHNKNVELDEDNRLAHFPTSCGYGRFTITKGYIGVFGMKSENETITELKKITTRLKLYYMIE